MLRHLSNDLFRKRTAPCRAPNQNRRLNAFDDLQQSDLAIAIRLCTFPLRVGAGELVLTGCNVLSEGLFDETVTVDEVERLGCLLNGDIVDLDDALAQLARDTQACCPRPVDHETLVGQTGLCYAHSGHDRGETDRARALTTAQTSDFQVASDRGWNLHIVVEDRVLVTVDVKEALRVANTEVFEMEQTMWVVLANELDESRQKISHGRALSWMTYLSTNLS